MREKLDNIQAQIQRLRQTIGSMDYVCTGTLLIRRYACGKGNCRCGRGSRWHHGPYRDWTRLVDGKFTHRRLTDSQAETVRRAIGNYKKILKLLRNWESETENFLSLYS